MSLTDDALFLGPPIAVIAATSFALFAPKRWPKAAAVYSASGFSPAWFALAPVLVTLVVALDRRALTSLATASLVVAGHLVIGGWLVARQRHWPWGALAVALTATACSAWVLLVNRLVISGPPH